MLIDVPGRVRNTPLSARRPLVPLYEAIVNSIQAIDDAKEPKGRIEIAVTRESNHLLKNHDPSFGDITGFEVTDNGVGFTDENYEAFQTSDTTYKAERGGKGVGRFLWLVAFGSVEIESHFRNGDKMQVRRFQFVAKGEGVQDESCQPSDQTNRSTTVRLLGFKAKYQKQCRKKPETLAAQIVEHCLEFFLRANCPKIILTDRTSGDSVDLNNLFTQEMDTKSQVDEFEVKDQRFHITHVRLYSSHSREHLVHFCAHDRVVRSENLHGRVPNLTRQLDDEQNRRFFYAAYVESKLLNDTVKSDRTDFAIEKDSTDLLPDAITWKDIHGAVAGQCRSYLEPYTNPIREKKRERINQFVANEAPMYRPIMGYVDEAVDRMDPDLDDDALDLELYKAYQSLAVATKAEGLTLLGEESETAETFDEFTQRLEAYFEKVTTLNAADLARYVCHRKAVLDFLQKLLGMQHDGKYPLEKHVHNIIFPMGKTSDEVLLEDHNLWLIDEKLAYHAFLASDKQLRTVPVLDSDSQKEPDIIVFDTACAFVPSPDHPFPAVTLIEFKRPMRDDYTEDDNPFVQVRKYIQLISENKARTPDGREIPIPASTPFYCFIVCDIGQTLKNWAFDFELQQTPDAQGFFGFKREYNAFFEVISYTKMVSDAKKRNAIFFDKLRLPSRISPATAAESSEPVGEAVTKEET